MDQNGIKIITHASTFFAPILVPIVVWLLVSDRETKNIALQALLFHIGIGLLISISAFFTVILIGFPFLVLFGLIGLYYPIKGIIYSLQGKYFHYPIVGRFLT